MKHGGDAQLCPSGGGILSELLQGLGSGLEQEGGERPLVHAAERIEMRREREDDREIGNREQQGLLRG
jgi:hypothetical protein